MNALTRLAALAAPLLLAACPICPDGDLRLVAGTLPVAPGESISLELRYDDYVAGPERCRGFWYVDEVLWGNETLGTVDDCGTYTAPAAPPDRAVRVEGGQYERYTCADCCPSASRLVDFARP
ncbi:MAG: hypothetical protein EP329_28570 [Deltaproteobacteria bacterium]|nr:MAG: hypothetical protein EP329_28570 [Deltaproteobacteria bacterium]